MSVELTKQYEPAGPEERCYRMWEERGYFHSEPDRAREPFTIVIPPPNVTGALHLGHALNNTLQDVLIRFKRMQGFNTLWMPGTDHAGIATQAIVEKRLFENERKTRHDLGREALVKRIWDWKAEYEKRILSQLKRLGVSCDWARTRFTLDDTCARAVRHTFFSLFKEGSIYRGKRLVNWDSFLQTAVSDDEVYHETVAGNFWHMKYPVIDPKPGEPPHVIVATTRPETMLGDTAVAVHPDPATALDKTEADLREKLAAAPEKQKEAISADLEALQLRRATMLPQLVQLRDMALAGRKVLLPLINREIPLVADEWAKPELGSGCVKITPAHDPNDYVVGMRQSLPMINIMRPDGALNEHAGAYQGLPMAKARIKVVADLEAQGLLDKVEDREIELAHSDRSKTAIEPYLADQWFVKMDTLAQSAMDAVTDGRVKIFPERYARGYLDWLSEKRDWPIGRQLWWGHRIPIWYCSTASEADLKKAFGDRRDVCWQWSETESRFLIGSLEQDLTENSVPGHKLVQDEDVLDTWFSSALWPHSTLGWPGKTPELDYFYPTSTLITSRDIITLWVARMVLMGIHNLGEVPFREVFVHPKILDGFGETMSKTKGNGVDPIDVIDKFGADALRFALAQLTTETQDVRMPVEFECPHCNKTIEQTKKNRVQPRVECKHCKQPFSTQWASLPADTALPRGAVISERFELARNFSNKLWNAARFTLMNLEGYRAAPVETAQLALEDRWLLSRLSTVAAAVTTAIEGYHYAEATRVLYEFAWDEFCSFYVEMVKNRLQDPQARPVAQRVLAYALDTLLRLLHPFMPFITEEIWQHLNAAAPERGLAKTTPGAESIVVSEWPKVDITWQNPEIEATFGCFQELLKALRDVRARQNIAPKTNIAFSVRASQAQASAFRPFLPYFASMAGADAAEWGPEVQPPATTAHVSLSNGDDLYVDLAGHIDIAAEIARNEKELEKMRELIGGKEKKLANDNFVARAPADVIAKERASLVEYQDRATAIEAALDKLRASA